MAQNRNVRGLSIAVTSDEILALRNPHEESSSQARPRGTQLPGGKYMPDDPWNEWREKIEASKNRPRSELSGDEESTGVETMLRIMEEQRRGAGIANPASTNPPVMHQAAIDLLTPEQTSNTARDEPTLATRLPSETVRMSKTPELTPPEVGAAGRLSEAAPLLHQTSGPAQVRVKRTHHCGTCRQRFPSMGKWRLHRMALAHVTYECGQCMDRVFLSPCRLALHRREFHALESSPDDLLARRVESTTHDTTPKVVPTGPWVPYFEGPAPYGLALPTLSSSALLESVSVPSEVHTQAEYSVYRPETTVEAPPCTSINTVDPSSDRGPNDQNVSENSTALPDNVTAQTTPQIYPRRHCGVCRRTFSSRKTNQLHNQVSTLRAYRCPDCNENFTTLCMFAVHQKDVHKIGYSQDDVLAVQAVPMQSAAPAHCTTGDASMGELVEDSAPSLRQHGISESTNATAGQEGIPAETVPLEFSVEDEKPDGSVPETHDSPWSSVLPLNMILGPSWKRKYEHICSDCSCPHSTADALEYHEKTYHPNDRETSCTAVDGSTAETRPDASGNLECSTCGLSFPSKGSKKRHTKVRFPAVFVYTCSACNEGFPTRCQLTVHCTQSHRGGCSGSGVPTTQATGDQTAGSSAITVQHMTSDVLPPLAYKSTTPSTRDWVLGQSSQDAAPQPFVQPLEPLQHAPPAGGNVPLSLSELAQSPPEETPVDGYWRRCHNCRSVFSSSELLSAHQLCENHDCPLCAKTYHSACAFYAHQDLCRGPAPPILTQLPPTEYRCCDCGKDFFDSKDLESHFQSCKAVKRNLSEAHQDAPAGDNFPLSLPDPVQSPQEETPVNKYWRVCQACRSFFSSSEQLSTHQKQLREEHDCSRCTKTYDSACAFYAHRDLCRRQPAATLKLKKPAPSEYQCCDCGKGFSDSKDLESHFQFCKAVERNLFECQSCNCSFKSREKLIKHNRGCKKIPCLSTTFEMGSSPTPASSKKKVCQKRFGTIAAMTAHLESGGCPSKLDRHQINALIVARDHEQTITLPAAASISSINSASFHAPPRALQTPAAVMDLFGEDSDSDVEVIFTPSTTAPGSPSGVLTPASGYSIVPLDSKSCPTCGAQFATEIGAAHHIASPVHDLPRYRCPSDLFFTQLGLKAPSDGARHRKMFKTLAGLVGHVERGSCRDGNDGSKVVTGLLRRLTGGDMVRMLGSGSA